MLEFDDDDEAANADNASDRLPAGDAGPRADAAFTLAVVATMLAVAADVAVVDASDTGGIAPPPPTTSERCAARRGEPCGVALLLLAAEPAGDERRASNMAAAAEADVDEAKEEEEEDDNWANEAEGERVRPDARPCRAADAGAEGSSENTSSLGESVAITMRWPLTMSADCKSACHRHIHTRIRIPGETHRKKNSGRD